MRKRILDDIKSNIAKGDFCWLFKRTAHYLLIHISFLLGRPLCGPILGTLVTNYSCNYKCKMCDLSKKGAYLKNRGLKELSTSQFKKVLKDFAALGTFGIGFTGGEPLLRDDIFELLKYTKDLGMIAHLNTNGSLISEEKAHKLLDCGIDSLNISLDGAVSETHNKIRGSNDAFEKAIDAVSVINRLKKQKESPIKTKIVMVLSEDNIDEMIGLFELSCNLGVDYVDFIPEQNFKGSFCLGNESLIVHSEEFYKKLEDTVKYFLRIKDIRIENSPEHLKLFSKSFKGEKSPLVCYAGYNSYGVDCYGFMYPCVPWFNWNRPIGSIKEIGLKEFWYSKKYNAIRKSVSRCRQCYINCQAELNLLFNINYRNK